MSERAHKLLLTETEREHLASAIESMLPNLSYEISNTDSHDYRDGLKEKRDVLQKVLNQLRQN